MSIEKAIRLIREPRRINAAQIVAYTIAAASGFMAVLGVANPTFMAVTIGPALIAVVGGILLVGGVLGAFAVFRGMWWLERIALRIVGTGWFALLPAALFYSVTGKTSATWLVVALVGTALADAYKRYNRIEWAYLDPTRP